MKDIARSSLENLMQMNEYLNTKVNFAKISNSNAKSKLR